MSTSTHAIPTNQSNRIHMWTYRRGNVKAVLNETTITQHYKVSSICALLHVSNYAYTIDFEQFLLEIGDHDHWPH